MRGSPCRIDMTQRVSGIIPAHAGLTAQMTRMRATSRDHPRACGAHAILRPTARSLSGSSPRMRGSHELSWHSRRAKRIIPAHAGLTTSYRTTCTLGRDHPRACGAHILKMAAEKSRLGSSPRMRGSHLHRDESLYHARIIPAHAGLTSCQLLSCSDSRDHPRACGAHL